MDDFVETRGARAKKNPTQNFVAVTYESHKKKKRKSEEVDSKLQATPLKIGDDDFEAKKKQDVVMKRARYDVIRFGMSGFEGSKKEEAKTTLAVKLGAKPPRNRRKNYKRLKEERLKVKEDAKKEEHVSGLSKSLVKRNSGKKRWKQPGLLSPYGKVQKTSRDKKQR